jgi:predicted ATPase/DNA-binding CsgD family transcriptional regulator
MGAQSGVIVAFQGVQVEESTPQRISAPLSRFFGRQRELDELSARLGKDRLVTIAGPGGVGKTRLALELARIVSDQFTGGTWLVDLAQITDSDLVARVVADSVGASSDFGANHLERAAHILQSGRSLLVLDNCEHVRAAVASVSVQLLARCPGLTMLATSREPLGLNGEQVWPAHPLTTPEATAVDAEAIGDTEAAQLFCDRAGLIAPGFRLSAANATDIVAICRRLDGLPLALELAAAWVPVLSLGQIAARLEDSLALLTMGVDERALRHRTMRAAIDWSYRLLSAAEQETFARFSVFVGGFDVEAATVVLAMPPLEPIASLVARSLLQADTLQERARYRLLEPVRQYAAEQLKASPEVEVTTRSRHLAYLVELAETAEEPMVSGADTPWLRRLDVELGNIRTALAWGFQHDVASAARLATALIWFCDWRGLFDEGQHWARQAMHSEGRTRARALHMAGVIEMLVGDVGSAASHLAEARRLMAEGQWLPDLALVVVKQGVTAFGAGDADAAQRFGEEALQLAREVGDEFRLVAALRILALAAMMRGEPQKADQLIRKALAAARRLENQTMTLLLLASLAENAIDMDDTATARRTTNEGLELSLACKNDVWVASWVEYAGYLAVRQGETALGLRLMGAARAARDRTRFREAPNEAGRRRHWVEVARRRGGARQSEADWRWGLNLALEEAVTQARAIVADAGAPVGRLGPLSRRESEISLLVSQGMTSGQIAARLHLSERTIENHVHNALNKLGLSSRAQLAAWVVRHEQS